MTTQELWQSQQVDAPRISLTYVRHRTQVIERRAQWRNAFEYVFAVLAAGYLTWTAWQLHTNLPLMAAGAGWFALFCAYIAVQWKRRAGVRLTPKDAGILDTLRYQRHQLARQRDARRGNWRWWLPMAIPGYALFVLSAAIEQGGVRSPGFWFLIAWFVVGTGVGIAIYERTARRLQGEIDALDSLSSVEPRA